MDALSIGWVPCITGRHLPIPIVPRCYANGSCSRRNGSLQLLRVSASTIIGKNTRFSKKISIFHVGEAPFCQFLPRMSRNCNLGKSSAKRRLSRTFTGRSLPVSPLALSKDQEYDQAEQENSAECDLGSSLSEISPYYPQPNASELKERNSILKLRPSFDGRYEREIFHREMLSRLKAAEAAAATKNHWVPLISDPDHERLRSASSSDMLGNSLAVEDENWLLHRNGGPARETGKLQLERSIDQKLKETRGMVKHRLPPMLDRLSFQFPPKAFFHRQSHQRAARVNVMVSYQMNYVLERTDFDLHVLHEPDTDVLDQNRILDSHSSSYYPRKPAVFPRAMEYRMSSRETTNVKMGMLTRERIGRSASFSGAFRHGRVRDPTSKLYPGSAGTFRDRSRVPVPAQNGTGRRLWSRAYSGVESAGNLFKDLLTIVGLVAFVVYGTYAFAMTQKYFKSGLWFRKISSESVTVARSVRETKNESLPKPADLIQAKVVEITDGNFVDTIQRRPTFVLFYASWCPYCQRLDPTWKELGNILSNKGYNIQLARMNAEVHPSTAANFKVVKYPTLIFFRGGIAVENYLGPRTVNSLVEFVDETLNKPL